MSPGDIITLLSGGSGLVGLIMLGLFISGYIVPKSAMDEKNEEIKELKRERDIHAARGDAGILAAQMMKELVSGLRKEDDKV